MELKHAYNITLDVFIALLIVPYGIETAVSRCRPTT